MNIRIVSAISDSDDEVIRRTLPVARSHGPVEETCGSCGKKMGYPADLPASDPRRYPNYVEESGVQLCDGCATRIYRGAPLPG